MVDTRKNDLGSCNASLIFQNSDIEIKGFDKLNETDYDYNNIITITGPV